MRDRSQDTRCSSRDFVGSQWSCQVLGQSPTPTRGVLYPAASTEGFHLVSFASSDPIGSTICGIDSYGLTAHFQLDARTSERHLSKNIQQLTSESEHLMFSICSQIEVKRASERVTALKYGIKEPCDHLSFCGPVLSDLSIGKCSCQSNQVLESGSMWNCNP